MNNKLCGLILGTGLALFATACGTDDNDDAARGSGGSSGFGGANNSGGKATSDPFASCSKAVLESDRPSGDQALAGPGVDPQTGALKPGSYLIATTYLALKPDKVMRALEFGGPVVESLFTMKGFVAFSTTASSTCASLRTLTVWASEEDMLAFVVSPAHLKAMPEISDLSRGTSNTIAWEGSEQEATWERAADQLAAEASGDR